MASTLVREPCYLFAYVMSICLLLCLHSPIIQADQNLRKTYIVYMGDRVYPNISAKSLYIDMLSGVIESVPAENTSDYLLYTYESFQGCVAKLTEKEAKIVSGMNGVVSVFLNRKIYSRTTRSWDFMGLPQNVERSEMESNVTIGVIDYGIWPESESFRDDGLGPPPAKWKGRCQTSNNFTCNNKVIGGQYFRADENFSEVDIASPRDTNGHGTHSAAIAAGGVVNMASFLGLGLGIARGGVPSARISVYKPCWADGCFGADVLAAFDAAISDGVDIISVSLGSTEATHYFEDPIAIGAFYAMRNGILTSVAAGNSGPSLDTLENFAPWFLSVAASTMDRKFTTKVKLGNGMTFEAISLNTFNLQNKTFPLIYGGDAPHASSNSSTSRFCLLDTLDKTLVKGKIVLCDTLDAGEEPFLDGAAGVIMHDVDANFLDIEIPFPLPASYLHANDGARVLSYIRDITSTTPFGTILKSEQVKDTFAPSIAPFSSRGPHPISPEILKPDLSAPGVNILSAWSPVASASLVASDPRSVPYSMQTGTSMACPHATAVAAYVKSFHPTWSEAAVKSALMTTALPMKSDANRGAELAYGSGHINPLKAKDPGLVYDIQAGDYVNYLCTQGYSLTSIRLITGISTSCEENLTNWDLNYPSIAIPIRLGDSFDVLVTRTVTNVGLPNSTYKAIVNVPKSRVMVIKVQPSVLSFKSLGQKLSYTVRVSGTIRRRTLIMSASLVWNDGAHQVRSPIVVFNLT